MADHPLCSVCKSPLLPGQRVFRAFGGVKMHTYRTDCRFTPKEK